MLAWHLGKQWEEKLGLSMAYYTFKIALRHGSTPSNSLAPKIYNPLILLVPHVGLSINHLPNLQFRAEVLHAGGDCSRWLKINAGEQLRDFCHGSCDPGFQGLESLGGWWGGCGQIWRCWCNQASASAWSALHWCRWPKNSVAALLRPGKISCRQGLFSILLPTAAVGRGW